MRCCEYRPRRLPKSHLGQAKNLKLDIFTLYESRFKSLHTSKVENLVLLAEVCPWVYIYRSLWLPSLAFSKAMQQSLHMQTVLKKVFVEAIYKWNKFQFWLKISQLVCCFQRRKVHWKKMELRNFNFEPIENLELNWNVKKSRDIWKCSPSTKCPPPETWGQCYET
jgi:hypothetical protein